MRTVIENNQKGEKNMLVERSECNHKNTVKIGKKLYHNGYFQMHRCLECATIIKGERLA